MNSKKIMAETLPVLFELSQRQKKILKYIVERHTKEAEAIGSNMLKNLMFNKISSATIRNDLSALEKTGFLVKEHTSSGRIPTKKAYQFYVSNLMTTSHNFKKFKEIDEKIETIFNKRHHSIDSIIDQTADLITKFVELPIVITKINDENELLKKIDIVNISSDQFMIFVITSYSNVLKYYVEISDLNQIADIETCMRIFNEHLIDQPINKILEKINQLTSLIRKKVHEYEFVFQKIILEIVKRIEENLHQNKSKIYNAKSLINQPEFKKQDLDLKKVMNLLENSSIFSHLKNNYRNTGKTMIKFNNELEGISIASTKVAGNGIRHQISIVGPTRMDYKLVNQILEYIHEKLSTKK